MVRPHHPPIIGSPVIISTAAAAAFVVALLIGLAAGRTSPGSGVDVGAGAGVGVGVGVDSDGAGWARADATSRNQFIDLWERSLTEPHVLSGWLRWEPVTSDDTGGKTVEHRMRRAQLDQRHRLDQVGSSATVTDPDNGVRRCRPVNGEVWCGQGRAVGGTGVRDALAGVTATITGVEATHTLYRLVDLDRSDVAAVDGVDRLRAVVAELRCWDARARSADSGHPWGRRTQFCFDSDTGALVLTRKLRTRRIETMIATDVTADVAVSDLDPDFGR